MTEVHHPLEPVFDTNSKVLILGSFPSVVSRREHFYYAHPSNRFWKVMSLVYQEEIHDRKQFCLDHGIALWDVIESCSIHGSDDASIQNVRVNDLSVILNTAHIHTVFTTGSKAYALYKKYMHYDVRVVPLSSTSSANARMRTEDLVREYSVIRKRRIDEED